MTGLKADVNASSLVLSMFIKKTIPQGVLYQSYIKNFIKNSMKGKMILLWLYYSQLRQKEQKYVCLFNEFSLGLFSASV